MGYRPNFKCLDNSGLEFYGTKLYGYCDTNKCLSHQYLVEIGKIDPEEVIWDYSFENYIKLTASQFAIFAALYEKDVNAFTTDFNGEDFSWDKPDRGVVKKMIEKDCDKEIWWD